MSEPGVEALGIEKEYVDGERRLQVLKGVSLNVKEGEGVAILGPSGSGKTTLLNILSGLDQPTKGSVRIGGVTLSEQSEVERAHFRNRHIGFIFQLYHLLPEFTALENVMLPALIRNGRDPLEVRRKAAALLARVGLEARGSHFPSELSGGEQQRVAVARALINDPKVVFCDEPTGNLDAETGAEVASLLKGLYEKEKKTVLIVTHDERIAKMASRVCNIVKGSLR